MAEFTVPKHGELCWYELNSQDVEKAKEFYRGLFGWKIEQSKVTEMAYSEIHRGNTAIGGMMQIDKQWGENWEKIPTHWMTYIAVDNCDETLEKITAHGGNVCVPAFDAPNVGRMAVVKDPSGATFSVIQFFAH
jgi:hypothetical protein